MTLKILQTNNKVQIFNIEPHAKIADAIKLACLHTAIVPNSLRVILSSGDAVLYDSELQSFEQLFVDTMKH